MTSTPTPPAVDQRRAAQIMEDNGMHVGRSWSGTSLEDGCPCPKAACGLVLAAQADPACDQHPPERCRTLRQGHRAADCPAVTA